MKEKEIENAQLTLKFFDQLARVQDQQWEDLQTILLKKAVAVVAAKFITPCCNCSIKDYTVKEVSLSQRLAEVYCGNCGTYVCRIDPFLPEEWAECKKQTSEEIA